MYISYAYIYIYPILFQTVGYFKSHGWPEMLSYIVIVPQIQVPWFQWGITVRPPSKFPDTITWKLYSGYQHCSKYGSHKFLYICIFIYMYNTLQWFTIYVVANIILYPWYPSNLKLKSTWNHIRISTYQRHPTNLRPETLRKSVPRRLRRTLRAAQRVPRGTLRMVLGDGLSWDPWKPWENHGETMQEMMGNDGTWWFHPENLGIYN